MTVSSTGSETVKTNKSVAQIAKEVQNFTNDAINTSNVLVRYAGSLGIAGFVFDIAQEEGVDLMSVITDHYVETGSPVQDHIALRPERVTVRGLVGEYKDIVSGQKTPIEKITQKLTTLASYLPAVSQAAGAIYTGLNDLKKAEGLVQTATALGDTASSLFEAYRNINIPQNEQQKAFIFFEALRNARATFTIQTPFRYYTDMAIESMRVVQSGATKDQSDFSISFKKIRYVDTEIKSLSQNTENVEKNESQGRLNEQKQSKVNNGIVAKTETRLTNSINSTFSGKPMSEVLSLKEQIEKSTQIPSVKGF